MASFKFLPYGAILQEFSIGGQNIVLSYPREQDYKESNPAYFGATIGRVANRIGNATLNNLNGTSYALPANNSGNTLHGGTQGWDAKTWDGPFPVSTKGLDGAEHESVVFKLLSPDGDNGFPGAVEASVTYIAYEAPNDHGETVTTLEIEYEAKLARNDGPEETVVSMTNHSYFNLSPPSPTPRTRTIANTRALLSTLTHQSVSPLLIPTGTLAPYPFPVTAPFTLTASEPQIDHCFIEQTDPAKVPLDTRAEEVKVHVRLWHPDSRINLEVASTEPSYQFYTGDLMGEDSRPGLEGCRRGGLAVEPARWIDAGNREETKGMVLLKRGEVYGSRIVYRAWVGAGGELEE